MEMEDRNHGDDILFYEADEVARPRVRLPLATNGIINHATAVQLQDELEETKGLLAESLDAPVAAKNEVIIPKDVIIQRLIEILPGVGKQIGHKISQEQREARENDETESRQLNAEQFEKRLQDMISSCEKESDAEMNEKMLSDLIMIAETHPHTLIGDAWTKVSRLDDRAKRGYVGPKEAYDQSKREMVVPGRYPKPAAAHRSHTVPASTLRDHGGAKHDIWKRRHNEFQPSEDGKSVNKRQSN